MVSLGLVSAAFAGGISGQITGKDGAGIRDAEVYAINPALQAAQTTTDADGRYAFGSLPEGQYRLWAKPMGLDPHVARYHPAAPSYCDGVLLRVDDRVQTVNMELPLGGSISGTVIRTDGGPIANIRIQGRSPNGAVPRSAETDEAGQFHLVGLEKNVGWQLQASKSGLPVQWWGHVYDQDDSPVLDSFNHETVEPWTLLNGVAISGAVNSPTGPVVDATVRIYSNRQLIQAKTDENGQYHAAGLPPGDVTAWSTATGLAVTYFPDDDRPGETVPAPDENITVENVDLLMPTEATFRIQLVGQAPRTGGDLNGLTAMLYNDTHTVGRAATSDEDGMVVWNQLHPGNYEILVYGGDAGHPDDWIRDDMGVIETFWVDAEPQTHPVPITMPLAITLTGEVLDDDGYAIPGALVLVTPGPAYDTGASEFEDALFVETTDAHGEYSLVGVPEGDWEVRAQLSPNCDQDPGFVSSYWPGEQDPLMADSLSLTTDQPIRTIDFVLARDDDHDQMSDRWERRYQLDTNSDDAYDDPDEDGFNNLLEFRMRTDPNSPEGYWVISRSCGCSVAKSNGPWLWMLSAMVAFIRRRA